MRVHENNFQQIVNVFDAIDRLAFVQRRFPAGDYRPDGRREVRVREEGAGAPSNVEVD